MGSFILCHNKKAKEPYKIARIQRRIYTLEELCFYLCNNLYLVDDSIVNEQLCEWIDQELELHELADSLREVGVNEDTMDVFVMKVLNYTSLYTAAEMSQIQDVLKRIKSQNPEEKKKCMADNLLENHSYQAAINLYFSVLSQMKEEDNMEFAGKVYACLGAAYGRLLQYKEAAKMYGEAYKRWQNKGLLKPYIFACERFMPAMEFQQFLSGNELYQSVYAENLLLVREQEEQTVYWPEEGQLEKWKEQYRRNMAGV